MSFQLPYARWLGVIFALAVSVACVAQDEPAEQQQPIGTFGFGLESSGSACCLSVRFWLGDERGSEMVLGALDNHLFITLRGLQGLAIFKPITLYAGLGMTLRFGQIVAVDPFSAFMAMQGFVALETPIPFYEMLIGNVEAAVEVRPSLGFSGALGLGVHYYF